jgi:hypothetical protein
MAVGTLYQKPLDAIELEPHRIQLANIPQSNCPASMDLAKIDTP